MTETTDDRHTDGAQTTTTTPADGASDGAVDEPPWETRATEPDALSLDTVFGLLRNERRRRVLRYLLTESATCELGELAEHLAARELDKPVHLLTSTERKRTYVALYQCHVPKLADAGVVDFDRGTVRLRDEGAQLTPYLALGDGDAARSGPRLAALATSLGVAVAMVAVATSLAVTGSAGRPTPSVLAVGVPAVAVAAWASARASLADPRSLSHRLRETPLWGR